MFLPWYLCKLSTFCSLVPRPPFPFVQFAKRPNWIVGGTVYTNAIIQHSCRIIWNQCSLHYLRLLCPQYWHSQIRVSLSCLRMTLKKKWELEMFPPRFPWPLQCFLLFPWVSRFSLTFSAFPWFFQTTGLFQVLQVSLVRSEPCYRTTNFKNLNFIPQNVVYATIRLHVAHQWRGTSVTGYIRLHVTHQWRGTSVTGYISNGVLQRRGTLK